MTADEYLETLGGRLLAARRALADREGAKVSQTELGDRLGLFKQQIARAEAGGSISMSTLLAMASALEVEPADLLEGLELADGEGQELTRLSVLDLAELARQLGTTVAAMLRARKDE